MLPEGRTFADRDDAGRQLAHQLDHLRGRDVVVLGLPRGGVPVAGKVAESLHAPLDVIVVRKLGVPRRPELGMGALGEEGVRILNPEVIGAAGVGDAEIAAVEQTERAALHRRVRLLRGDRPPARLAGRTAVVVDDGVATGSTARAACQVARARGAEHVVLAVPVAAAEAVESLRRDCDEVVCVQSPTWLWSVGQWYENFTQTTDDEVRDLLAQAPPPGDGADSPPGDTAAPPPGDAAAVAQECDVVACPHTLGLPGHLTVPAGATGLVMFVHGSGSSRHSPRNRYVASVLHRAGLGTLLFDLLTAGEAAQRANVFDIGLLAARLTEVTAWVRGEPWGATMPIGWFGASTGAAAALWAAAAPDAGVAAIVSRGGRPDLAQGRLPAVTAATLLVVGGLDTRVLELNRAAQRQLRCVNDLVVVPGATHLFEEPGTLTAAAQHAERWFLEHLFTSPG